VSLQQLAVSVSERRGTLVTVPLLDPLLDESLLAALPALHCERLEDCTQLERTAVSR